MDGTGEPVAITVNVAAVPIVNVVLFALVMAGAALTVRVKFCVASGDAELCALKTMLYVPSLPAAGIPARVPVPFPLSTNDTPVGRDPVLVNDGAGEPAVVTVKVPANPVVKVVLLALVIAGAALTVRVKFWVASGETTL
jgi:hypothetical protein